MSRDRQWIEMLQIVTGLFDYGEEIYTMLLRSLPEQTEMIVCPAHMGDTLLIASLAKEYKRQNELKGLIYVATTLSEEILMLFPEINSVLMLDKDEMKSLRFYMLAKKLWHQNGIRYAHGREWIYFDYPSIFTRGDMIEPRLSFKESRLHIMGLEKGSQFSMLRVPPFDRDHELKERYDKSVLIMPVSYSTDLISNAFWEKLASRIKEHGYDVYTNYNGAQGEEVIAGTMPFQSSYYEFAQMTGVFDLFVGIRSGLCDLISLTGNGKLVILYDEKTVPGSTIHIDEESIKESNIYDLGRREGITCYRYLSQDEEKVIRSICSHLPQKEFKRS